MAEKDAEEVTEGKKGSKLIMIGALAVLLIGGGAGYYFFLRGDSEPTDEKTEVVEPETKDLYYDLGKPFIVNFPQGSVASLIQISVTLALGSEATLDVIKKHEPMIRNNLLMQISSQTPENLMTKEGKEQLQQSMLSEVELVLERMAPGKKVKGLFFTTFVMQ
jgi:flagellar FliL protein